LIYTPKEHNISKKYFLDLNFDKLNALLFHAMEQTKVHEIVKLHTVHTLSKLAF